ncbi:MAG: ABC transporter permease, partial [Aquamicrobium sp.]|nr:ABC transporter permease [Aquamicrobium sp.]
FLLLPVIIMVPVSFTESARMTWPPEGFSLRWYETLFGSQVWTQAAVRSLIVAVASATLALIIGTPAAFAIARQNLPAKTLILAIILSPLIMPRIVIAVALFYLYAQIGLVGSYTGLILGHTILAVPYVVITVIAVQKQYDPRYDQAAWSLGARPSQTLRRVTLPLIRGGLLSAFLFAMITSFDELTIALFVTGGLTTTLPKQMWDDAINVATPTLAALSTLLLVFVAVMTLIGQRLQSRS